MGIDMPKEAASITDNWFVDAFGELYPVVYAHRTVEAAVPEVEFAAKVVGLTPEDAVLDLCCGAGRHLVTLERYGARLTGLDFSSQLLACARERLAATTALVRGDMHALPFKQCFDVVFSFFTSFGYFMEDTDNAAAAAAMARVLKPSGRFYMDYLNPSSVAQHLVPETLRESQGYTICEKRWIDQNVRRVNKVVSVSRAGTVVGTTSESVRLYSLEELTALLADVGLMVKQVWGNCSGGGYGPDAERMILSGTKAAA
jgi:ubiquinone/menaquinone biosynthesis C-methylase UbiE